MDFPTPGLYSYLNTIATMFVFDGSLSHLTGLPIPPGFPFAIFST